MDFDEDPSEVPLMPSRVGFESREAECAPPCEHQGKAFVLMFCAILSSRPSFGA